LKELGETNAIVYEYITAVNKRAEQVMDESGVPLQGVDSIATTR
jgi:hypothetical protein